jgi:acetylglutamate kinase
LTGADDRLGLVEPAPPLHATDGRVVDLGRVGAFVAGGRPSLVRDLVAWGYVPIIASIGATADGRLFNVNADTLAAHLAAALGAGMLLVAGGTAGVLDGEGRTIETLDRAAIDAFVADGRASAGMVAKLVACAGALDRGVGRVRIVDGRATPLDRAPGTDLVIGVARR